MTITRPYVSFRCNAFNTTEEKEDFERANNFGDDVADWLADRLSERGWEVSEELDQSEMGWFFTFGRDRDEFDLGVTALNADEGRWLAWVEAEVGFFGALFGGRNREIPEPVLSAIQDCLTADPLVSEIKWHTREEFHRGNLEGGSDTPWSLL